MQTQYNVKETALWFASFEPDTEAVTWSSGKLSFRRHRSRAFGKTNQPSMWDVSLFSFEASVEVTSLEFSSNTHSPKFPVILKTLISGVRCV